MVLAGAAWIAKGLTKRTVRREPGLSVLLITIDTLRADALGCYGRSQAETPWMDRLAAGGVRLEQAHAHNVVTLPSHANILSGRYPLEHGVRDNAGFRLPERIETLATLFKSLGYRTGAFVSAFPLDSRFGLARGFDVYNDQLGDEEATPALQMQERPGVETVQAAVEWLSSDPRRASFLWLHLYEPHAPYQPPEPWASRFASEPYQGEVAATDAALAPLLEPLLRDGPAGRTLIVLTADHGEALGEHGEKTHGIFAYEATLRTPLMFYCPRLFSPRVASSPATHVDILPTILDALGATPPTGLPGRSLLALFAGRPIEPRAAYFESFTPATAHDWAPLQGVLADGMKLIELPIPELYDLAADPREERNLVAQRTDIADRLRARLAALKNADRGPAPTGESREVRERLAGLGYVATTPVPRRSYAQDDDPKLQIALEAELDDVLALYNAGRIGPARVLCERIVRERPRARAAHLRLAQLAFDDGDLAGAVAAAQAALALQPANAEAAALLGGYLGESGRYREAVELLLPFSRRANPDLDVLSMLGSALGQSGRRAEALEVLEKARQLDSSNALVLVNLGTVHLLAHDLAQARGAFEAALALEPRLARAHNSLGVVEAESGQLEQALASWRRALDINPRDYQALFNLVRTLWKQGNVRQALPHAERFLQEAPEALFGREVAQVRTWVASRPEAIGR